MARTARRSAGRCQDFGRRPDRCVAFEARTRDGDPSCRCQLSSESRELSCGVRAVRGPMGSTPRNEGLDTHRTSPRSPHADSSRRSTASTAVAATGSANVSRCAATAATNQCLPIYVSVDIREHTSIHVGRPGSTCRLDARQPGARLGLGDKRGRSGDLSTEVPVPGAGAPAGQFVDRSERARSRHAAQSSRHAVVTRPATGSAARQAAYGLS
jgi:hypothetical protein